MEAGTLRRIKSGVNYDHLFPGANTGDHTIKRNAAVTDTVAFIPKVVNETLHQTKGIASVLQGATVYDTCHNIWDFVYNHIAYRKDRDGYEQIRSPSRTWHDRRAGVDCDCYTTFISSILTNLGIPHQLRITKYSRDYFQHIYPLAVHNGKEIIIDCVTDKFDYEVPYSAKKDYPMDLQYLDGIDNTDNRYDILVNGTSGLEELGRLFKTKKKSGNSGGGSPAPDDGNTAPGSGAKKKKGLKKLLNKVNKINPATLALRNGVLAAMKLNILNIAKRMRWSYLSANQAKAKGINPDKWKKLVAVRQKLENIFYGAGGNPDNLKKAMLKGKGNKDNAVHGLDGIGRAYDYNVNTMNRYTPLPQLLGGELFYDENPMSALGELGEPVTAATITAASGVLAVIAGMIKKIGDIFGGKGKESADFDESANPDGDTSSTDAKTESKGGGGSSNDTDNSGDGNKSNTGTDAATGKNTNNSSLPATTNNGNSSSQNTDPDTSGGGKGSGDDAGTSTPAKKPDSGKDNDDKKNAGKKGGSDNDDDKKPEGMWEQNKKWIIPVGIGVGVITAIAVGATMMKPHPNPHPTPAKPVNGIAKKGKNHQRKPAKNKKEKIKSVTLL